MDDALAPWEPWARFDDAVAGTAVAFPPPYAVIAARSPGEVAAALDEADRASQAGAWAVGYVAYEAAAGLGIGPSGPETDEGTAPLVWFGLCEAPAAVAPIAAPPGTARGYGVNPWTASWNAGAYLADVERVREHIARGDVYQCNLTVRLDSCVEGELTQLYADLALNQRTRYGTYLDLGRQVLLSASPELFFEWRGEQLTTRPMKGTAARGRTLQEDHERLLALTRSEKERAENIIVVDLLRNDVGRVAVTGSVHVTALCVPERYETVWQLTSDVTGTLPSGTGLLDVFRALFPSGSVTGAPKHRAMEIIQDLEARPRGVYCGALGFVAPPSEPVRARFSVGIRTLLVDRPTGRAVYGTGGGITWASQPAAELAELRAKAAILRAPHEEVELWETMAYEPVGGVRHLERHLRRLAASAEYFGFPFDRVAARAAVLAAISTAEPRRVRLSLRRTGELDVGLGPFPTSPLGPVRLVVDPEPVDRAEPWLYHKTSRRQTYTERADRHPGADDVVLVNDAGEVTETTIANLAVLLGGAWWTPPVDAGCLPGIERGRLLERGVLRERTLVPADLARADGLALVNSLRGWRSAVLAASH